MDIFFETVLGEGKRVKGKCSVFFTRGEEAKLGGHADNCVEGSEPDMVVDFIDTNGGLTREEALELEDWLNNDDKFYMDSLRQWEDGC